MQRIMQVMYDAVQYDIKYNFTMCCILQNGYTALHIAASHGYLEFVMLQINNGCNINAANEVSYVQ